MTEFFVTTSGGVTTRLDLQDGIPLPLTYNILDIREPETQVSHWSKTLKFPGTKTNNQVFRHIFEIGIDGGFNPNKKADIYVLQDTLEVLRGVLQLKKITRSEQLDLIYYECHAFSGTDGIFTIIGEDKLTDLDFSEYDHIYNETNQEDSWDAPVGNGYVYPMIDYKGIPGQITWFVDDFFPALYVKEYIDKIFAYAGKTYDSEFFDTERFKRLIIPFNKEEYRFRNEDIIAREFRAERITSVFQVITTGAAASSTVIFNNDSTGTAYDPSGIYNTTTGVWTVPTGQGGRYTIRFSGTVQGIYDGNGGNFNVVDQGEVIANLFIMVNGVKMAAGHGGKVLVSSASPQPDQSTAWSFNASVTHENILLAEGDVISIQLMAWSLNRATGNPVIFGAGDSIKVQVLTGAYFKNTLINILEEGVSIDMNSCIPDNVTMKSFLLGIIDMFRLYMQVDPDDVNNYIIEPREDWYTSDVIDWSDKLDRKQGLEIIPMAELQGKRYIFRYKEDKDYYNDDYQKNYVLDGKPRTYGDKIIDVDNDFVLNDVIFQTVFSATPMSIDATAHNRVIPRLFHSDGQTAKRKGTNIKILYWGGMMPFDGELWHHFERATASVTARNQYPYAGHLDNPYDPAFDLSWGVPIEVYWDISRELYTDANLYNVYHKRATEEITHRNARLVSGYFRLKPTDIFNLSFRKLYYFEGEKWRLNKIIDYDLSTEKLTKCEFIKALDIEAFVPTQETVTGGKDDVFGSGGGTKPRPPIPPVDPYENDYEPRLHTVRGTGNHVPKSASGIVIVGDDNVIIEGAVNVTIIGSENTVISSGSVTLLHCNGLTVTKDDVLYINNCEITDCQVNQDDIDDTVEDTLDDRSGQAELVDSMVNVANGAVTINAVILITPVDTFTGKLTVTANAGSFDIDSDIAGESGTVNWFIASY